MASKVYDLNREHLRDVSEYITNQKIIKFSTNTISGYDRGFLINTTKHIQSSTYNSMDFFAHNADNRNKLHDYISDVIIFFWPFTDPMNPVEYGKKSTF
jgi:hypothetical protein